MVLSTAAPCDASRAASARPHLITLQSPPSCPSDFCCSLQGAGSHLPACWPACPSCRPGATWAQEQCASSLQQDWPLPLQERLASGSLALLLASGTFCLHLVPWSCLHALALDLSAPPSSQLLPAKPEWTFCCKGNTVDTTEPEDIGTLEQ